MDGLTEGRIVHYVMPNGEHRPAVVAHVWRVNDWQPGPDGELVVVGLPHAPTNGCCNLSVVTDYSNDVPYKLADVELMKNSYGIDPAEVRHGHIWRTSVLYSEEPNPNTWHWIEKA